jgi:hypothetical protein
MTTTRRARRPVTYTHLRAHETTLQRVFRRHARFVEHTHTIVQQRDQAPVDDEPRGVVAGDRLLAEPLHKGVGRVEDLVARERGSDHLDQGQHRRGVEEVHADDAFPAARCVRDLRDGERRGVRREDRVGLDDLLQLAEELPFDAEVLEGGLDHELARAEVGEVGHEREPSERRVLVVLRQAAFLDASREVMVDPLARLLSELGSDLAADYVEPGLQANLRDPGAHGAEADHADATDLHGARS